MIDFMCYVFENVFLSEDSLGAEIYWSPHDVLPVFVEQKVVGYAAYPNFQPDGLYCSVVSDVRLSGSYIHAYTNILKRNMWGQPVAVEINGFCCEEIPPRQKVFRAIDQPEFLTLKL